MDRLERRIRRHVLDSLPAAGRAHLADDDLAGLLIEYGTWRDRFVSPARRAVKVSRELAGRQEATTYASHLAVLQAKLETGTDITTHLSERVRDPFANTAAPKLEHRSDRDALLSDWGIHHLHLTNRANAVTIPRGRDVLLAAFTEATAYLITIVAHPTATDGWATQDIFDIVARNWPSEGLVHQVKDVVGLSQQYSDHDRRALRNAGVATFMEVDGKVYAPGRLGQTTAGTPMMITRGVNELMWKLKSWRDDFDGMLSKASDINDFVYWTPAVQAPLPGFEEYAGFAGAASGGPVFVAAARIV